MMFSASSDGCWHLPMHFMLSWLTQKEHDLRYKIVGGPWTLVAQVPGVDTPGLAMFTSMFPVSIAGLHCHHTEYCRTGACLAGLEVSWLGTMVGRDIYSQRSSI